MTKHEQVAKQYEAVAYLAREIAKVHEQQVELFRGNHAPTIIDIAGKRSAQLMEELGDWLSAMDSVADDAPEWIAPAFREAQRLWPSRE